MLKPSPLYLRSLSPPPFRALGSTPEVSSGLKWIQRTFIVVSRRFMTPADDISPAGSGSCLYLGLAERCWMTPKIYVEWWSYTRMTDCMWSFSNMRGAELPSRVFIGAVLVETVKMLPSSDTKGRGLHVPPL